MSQSCYQALSCCLKKTFVKETFLKMTQRCNTTISTPYQTQVDILKLSFKSVLKQPLTALLLPWQPCPSTKYPCIASQLLTPVPPTHLYMSQLLHSKLVRRCNLQSVSFRTEKKKKKDSYNIPFMTLVSIHYCMEKTSPNHFFLIFFSEEALKDVFFILYFM